MATPAVRNNNPGNLKDPKTGAFRVFNSPQEGYNALKQDLQTKLSGASTTGITPKSSLSQFASVWAPSSDKNNPQQYAMNLSRQLGVTPDTPISSLGNRVDDFAKAIAQNEDVTMASKLKGMTGMGQSGSLAQKIKAKYPQYNDIPDAELEQKILAKYPQYADMASGSQASQPQQKNLPGVGALGDTMAQKISTQYQQEHPAPPQPTPEVIPAKTDIPGQLAYSGKHIMDFAKKVTNAAGLGDVADIEGSQLARIAHPEYRKYIPEPSAEQVAGGALKLGGTIAGLGLAPGTIGGAALVGAGVGGATQAGGAMTQNAPAQQVAQQGSMGALLGGALGAASAGIGKLLGRFGDKVQVAEIKPLKADLEDGFDLATIKKNNLGGTLNQVAKNTEVRLSDLQNQLTQKLADSDASIDLAEVFDKTVKDMKSEETVMRNFGSNTNTSSALQHLENEVLTANPSGTISIPQAQLVKQGAGGAGAWSYGQTDPDATARQVVYNKFYRNLKEAIEQNSPEGVKEINKQMSELIPVRNAVLRRLSVVQRNNPISLTDFLGLLQSTQNPAALGVTGLNFLSKSGAVGNQLSKNAPAIGNRIAPMLSLMGTPFAGALNQSQPRTSQ